MPMVDEAPSTNKKMAMHTRMSMNISRKMVKIKMLVELEYDANVMHRDDKESKRWFMEDILLCKGHSELLLLHSNMIGDTVGEIRVLEVHQLPGRANVPAR